MPIVPLNLPQCKLQLSKNKEKIHVFCLGRKKKIILTPEEWVRQHVINYLIEICNVPGGLIHVEKSLQYNKLTHRADLLIYDKIGEAKIIVECKAPEIEINDSVLYQAARYAFSLNVPFLFLSNGLDHFFLERSQNQDGFLIHEDFENRIRNLYKK